MTQLLAEATAYSLSTPVAAALVLACAVLAATYVTLGRGVRYSRRALYALLRALALACLALVLIRPERVTKSEVTRKRTLALMLDGSGSMSLPVAPGSGYSRGAKLEEILRSMSVELDALGRRFELAPYEFAGDVRRIPSPEAAAGGPAAIRAPVPSGEATALGDSLLEVLDRHGGRRLAGVVVLSDGASNLGVPGPEAARALSGAGVPVHAIGIGEGRELADLSLDSLEAPPRARAGVPVRLAARVLASGLRRHEAEVTITVAASGRREEVERRRVPLAGPGSSAEVRASFTPRSAGTFAVRADVAVFPGEAVTANNHRMTFVQVERSAVRVLYLEGVLRPDFGALRRALAAAGDFELDVVRAFVRARSGQQQRPHVPASVGAGAADPGSPPLPGGARHLAGIRPSEYDVFVVGEFGGGELDGGTGPEPLPGRFVREIERLVREDGRGLVVFSGPAALARPARGSHPLHPLLRSLPVVVAEARPSAPSPVRPSAAGAGHPALGTGGRSPGVARTWSDLGPLGDLPAAAKVRRAGEALLVAEGGAPVLVAGRAGAGRAAVMLSGKTHVWKRNPRAPKGMYEGLVRSLVAWAAGRESPSAAISVMLPRHRLTRGDEVTLTARLNRGRAREAGLSEAEIARVDLVATVTGPEDRPGEHPEAETIRLRRQGDAVVGKGDAFIGTVRARSGGVFRLVVEPSRVEPSRVGPSRKDDRLAAAETAFVVERDDREFRDLAADPAALRSLAEATGGLFTGADRPEAVFGPLLRSPAEKATLVRRTRSVWDAAWVAVVFVAALFTEWWMRRR